ncbi:hypothetical protein [Kitasatospora sp. NPDC001527]|uniref:hypothetical protein n=1 Tax=Kitasatospora sp. NPDC001527 TaxID=3154519 RepID=UPI00331BE3E7
MTAAAALLPILPAVPGGIVLRVTRTKPDGTEYERVESPPVATPDQAMRSMRRTARAYTVLMTPLSRTAAHLWAADVEELRVALHGIANGIPCQRSWTLRNRDVLTLTAVPAAELPQPAHGAGPVPLRREEAR